MQESTGNKCKKLAHTVYSLHKLICTGAHVYIHNTYIHIYIHIYGLTYIQNTKVLKYLSTSFSFNKTHLSKDEINHTKQNLHWVIGSARIMLYYPKTNIDCAKLFCGKLLLHEYFRTATNAFYHYMVHTSSGVGWHSSSHP